MVAVKAVNFSTIPFCTEFWCESNRDDGISPNPLFRKVNLKIKSSNIFSFLLPPGAGGDSQARVRAELGPSKVLLQVLHKSTTHRNELPGSFFYMGWRPSACKKIMATACKKGTVAAACKQNDFPTMMAKFPTRMANVSRSGVVTKTLAPKLCAEWSD